MTSLQAKILSILSGIDEASIRIEISKTIFYLFEIYRSGKASDEDILQDLFDVSKTIVTLRGLAVTPEEIEKKSMEIAKDLLNTFKASSLYRRVASRRHA